MPAIIVMHCKTWGRVGKDKWSSSGVKSKVCLHLIEFVFCKKSIPKKKIYMYNTTINRCYYVNVIIAVMLGFKCNFIPKIFVVHGILSYLVTVYIITCHLEWRCIYVCVTFMTDEWKLFCADSIQTDQTSVCKPVSKAFKPPFNAVTVNAVAVRNEDACSQVNAVTVEDKIDGLVADQCGTEKGKVSYLRNYFITFIICGSMHA